MLSQKSREERGSATKEFPELPQEHERKFLVTDLDSVPEQFKSSFVSIRQGYIVTRRRGLTLRVRSVESSSADGTKSQFFLTVKSGHSNRGRSCSEVEREIDSVLFGVLFAMISGGTIEKRRSSFREGDFCFDLDVYEGKHGGLVMVEVETARAKLLDELSLPSWFGREVTGIREYKNSWLANHGLPVGIKKKKK